MERFLCIPGVTTTKKVGREFIASEEVLHEDVQNTPETIEEDIDISGI